MKKILFTLVLALLVTTSSFSQEKKKEFTPGGKVWLSAFMDYYYKVSGDTLGFPTLEYSRTPKDKQAFAFRRVNLGFDYNFSEKFSTELVAEFSGSDLLPVTNFSGQGIPNTTSADGKSTVFIKLANIRWKNIFTGSDLIVGQLSTPAFSLLSEKVWGFRNVEKTMMDQRAIAGSYDFGAGLYGKFDKEGTFGYNVMIANGRGARLENNKFKKYYSGLYGYFFEKKLVVEVYGDYEDKSTASNTFTLKGFTAFQIDKFRIGVEVFQQGNHTDNQEDVRPFGVSAFTSAYFFTDKELNLNINAFARYDYFDPNNNNTTSGYKESFFTLGVDFQIDKQIHIVPNLWLNAYSDKSSANVERKTDIVPRITVSFKTL